MSAPAGAPDPLAARPEQEVPAAGERARGRLAAASRRLEGSWLEDLLGRLKGLDFLNSIVIFGAALMMSVLPLIILLSSLANERIDDDISRHIGLNHRGAAIVDGLFRKSPTHAAGPIVLGLIVAFAGTMVVVNSLQVTYEDVFEQEHRGWRDLPRFIVWVGVLGGSLIAEAVVDKPVRSVVGQVGQGIVNFLAVTLFFVWTMHFLLAGRVPWRQLIRPALVTAILWLGLALFSAQYFSSAIVTEHRLYGTIGVVFILLTWFIAIGAVTVLGAVCGAAWQGRARRAAPAGGPQAGPAHVRQGGLPEGVQQRRD